MMHDSLRETEEREERELQRQLEAGDDDDHVEEDMHGSRLIDEPDDDEDQALRP